MPHINHSGLHSVLTDTITWCGECRPTYGSVEECELLKGIKHNFKYYAHDIVGNNM